MERSREFDDDAPPTFGEVLELVASGEMLGFTVFDKDGDISYSFCDVDEPLEPSPLGELRLPMLPEEARDMLVALREESAEELDETGQRADPDVTGLN
jgi:hypothetical protein